MKYLTLLILITGFTADCFAQITFTESDYINLEKVRTKQTVDTALDASKLAPLTGESGPNQTWDFTKASYNQVETAANSIFVPYSDTIVGASDPSFLSATYVEQSPATSVDGFNLAPSNEFYEINSSGAWDLGGCSNNDGIAANVLTLEPPSQIFPFPLRYQSSWRSTSEWYGSPYATWTTQIEAADGYGTLILPNYSGDALRVKLTSILKDSIQGVVTIDTNIFYDFYTLDGYTAVLGTSSDGSIRSASYMIPSNSAVTGIAISSLVLAIAPNPVISETPHLRFSLRDAGDVRIELMDILGKRLQILEDGFETSGAHSLPINTKALSPGTYFVRLQTSNGMNAMRQLIVQ